MAGAEAISFFPGFAWAVPEAFAAAVCSYRFEQGDVLHRDRRGYDALAGRIPRGLTAVQLRRPPRSGRTVPGEIEGDRRLSNWQSEVELDLVDLAAGTSESRTTTQGRLMMLLWQGDDDWLDPEREAPPLPRSARELAQSLREGRFELPVRRGGPDGCRFVLVVDLSSDASRVKAATVADALCSLGRVELRDQTPGEVGAPESDRFHPTLVLRELVLRGVTVETAEATLKRALYAGSGDRERFQLARHGLLEPVSALAGR